MNKIIFPGSFDPITLGHIDLIKRASKHYDEVVVLVIEGSKKTMFDLEARIKFVEMSLKEFELKNVVVDSYNDLVVKYCSTHRINLLLRGLRNVTDLAYEHNMTIHNRYLNHDVETVCLLAKPEHFHISSSSVRELIRFNGDISYLVSKSVCKKIMEEYNETL